MHDTLFSLEGRTFFITGAQLVVDGGFAVSDRLFQD
jgi:hypothetical protein